MKKLSRRILPLFLLIATLLALAVTASAAELTMFIGDEEDLLFSEIPYVSSNPAVVEVKQGSSDIQYIAVAKSEGTATLTGSWGGHTMEYTVTVISTVPSLGGMGGHSGFDFDKFKIFVICLIVFLVLLQIAEILYIFIAAPKRGMSRLWALLPLVSRVIGLIVFIVVFSKRKETPAAGSPHTITCPTCNSVHPKGTTRCNICGTDLT